MDSNNLHSEPGVSQTIMLTHSLIQHPWFSGPLISFVVLTLAIYDQIRLAMSVIVGPFSVPAKPISLTLTAPNYDGIPISSNNSHVMVAVTKVVAT